MSDNRRPATTIGELDIHLGHVMDELKHLNGRIDQLATTAWVADQLRVRDEKIQLLSGEVSGASVTTRLKRISEVAQQLAIIVGCIGGAVVFIIGAVHYSDKLPR